MQRPFRRTERPPLQSCRAGCVSGSIRVDLSRLETIRVDPGRSETIRVDPSHSESLLTPIASDVFLRPASTSPRESIYESVSALISESVSESVFESISESTSESTSKSPESICEAISQDSRWVCEWKAVDPSGRLVLLCRVNTGGGFEEGLSR